MVLYVAADAPLPEIPALEPPGAFSAQLLAAPDEPVRVQFTKPFVYFLGAHEGCSCGFRYGVGDEDADAAGRESVRRLGEYLIAAVDRLGSVELYSCWADEEGESAETREFLTTTTFTHEAEAFELPQRWFATIIAAAS
ncbi:MAG TPA: hypothetical protein VFW98_17555 [Gemmatimonadaceae bacterium]|nr:hypothetical protein [Gemmatimonadaceae bacterium]